MSKNIHYVYVYLDPRKPGNYTYLENGIGITFNFEPFYIGEGKKERWKEHLKEARKKYSRDLNIYKLRKIRKILSLGLEPIIYKISEKMLEQDALNLERTLGFLIGRYDQKRGPLTNLADCGGKTTNLSEESKKKKICSYNKTMIENPSIKINSTIALKETLKNNPEISIKQAEKRKETYKNNPAIKIRAEIKKQETLKNNPNIQIESGRKQSQTKKEHPEIVRNAKIKEKETKNNDPSIMKNAGKKCSKTMIENKTNLGKNHSQYVEINYEFLIIGYFNFISITDLLYNYNMIYRTISRHQYDRFLKILNFPLNAYSFNSNKNQKRVYIEFIEKNKNNIKWFINNYTKLEEDYWEKLNIERHK